MSLETSIRKAVVLAMTNQSERGSMSSNPPVPLPRPIAAAQPRTASPPRATAPASGAKPSRLGAVKKGQLRSQLRHLFYGPEGVGKSSLAADAPAPLFLDLEGGADNLDVARYAFRDEPGGHVPRSYGDVLEAVDDLIGNPGHGYQTVAIDTVDALEALIHRHICDVKFGAGTKSGIEDFGFGKGYKAAVEELRRFLARLDALRATGVQVVMIGHSVVATFKNPEGEDFDRYQLHCHRDFGGQIKEWCDVVGFIRFEGGAAKLTGDTSKSARARGWSTARRLVHLSREAAWDAKCRLSLPAELELDATHPWAPFAAATHGAQDATSADLVAAIDAELMRIIGGDGEFVTAAGRTTSPAAIRAMTAAADAATLTRILAGLRATTAITSTES